jgi:hypothetical protein
VIRIGDVFSVERAMGNGHTYDEAWTVVSYSIMTEQVEFEVSRKQKNGKTRNINKTEKAHITNVMVWAANGRRRIRGGGLPCNRAPAATIEPEAIRIVKHSS